MAAVKASTVIAMANKYVGTKESPANSNNVIFNTHYYGKAVSGSSYPWCAVFLWDIFRLAGASSLFYGGKKCAYTPTLANFYKSQNRFYSTPKVGDIVFYQFSSFSRINHVGIVIEVISNKKIKTIEGNTGSGNDANGGAVMIRERATTYVKGYGRPAYGTESATNTSTHTTSTSTYTKKQFIKDIQSAAGFTGSNLDGIAGPKTLSATVTLSKSKNRKHSMVLAVQKRLNSLGYSCGSADGVFGSKTDAAVRKYQSWMNKPDGEITAKGNTWKHLLGLA